MKIKNSGFYNVNREDVVKDDELNKYEEIRNVEKNIKDMSSLQILREYGIIYLIKLGLRDKFFKSAKEEYESKLPIVQLKNLHQQVLLAGPKGSVQRYKKICYFLNTAIPKSDCNEFIYYNELLMILYESIVEPELIDKVIEAQQKLLARSKSKYARYGVSTDVKFIVNEIKIHLRFIINKKEAEWNRYCNKMKRLNNKDN